MTQLTTDAAITRFVENEERVDKFVNQNGSYQTNEPTPRTVETLPSFLERKDFEVQEYVNSTAYEAQVAISILSTFNPRGAWAGTTSYALRDVVTNGDNSYVAIIGHTSAASFATDLAAGKWFVAQGVLSSDLSNSTDSAKGGAVVGYKGASVSGTLTLEKRKPRKVFSKLFAAASAAAHVRYVGLGDSLASKKMVQVIASLDRRMGGNQNSGVNTAGNNVLGSAGMDLATSGAVSVTNETGAYAYWPTGSVMRINAGGSSNWIQGGVNPTFENVKVYYVKEPGAGTINLLVNGVNVASASADASASLGVLTYTQALTKLSVSTTVTGAPVRLLFVHIKNPSSYGVDSYGSMAQGGLLLANAVSSAQGRAIWQAALADIAPDLVDFEMDDSFGDGGATDAAFALLVGILDAACPNADKLIIASTPRASDDAGKLTASNYLRGFCASKNASWLFFDSYYLLGSYAEMNAIFGADDGTHPTASAEAFAAETLWSFLGLNGFNLGFTSRAVNDAGTPSRLAQGSIFGSASDRQIKLNSDAYFGYDWTFAFPRTLSFTNAAGVLNWQFSANTAVNPNVVPLGFDFATAGGTRRFTTETTSGPEFANFVKTDNPNQRMNFRFGLVQANFTRAQLLAINANAVTGAIAFCTDCTGGAQLVYARGTGTTDWLTVDGKTAI